MTGSIRARVTLVATVVVAVVLVVAGIGLVLAQRRSLTRSLEEALAREADSIVAAAEQGDVPETLEVPGDDDAVGQVVVGSTGTVVAATPNVDGRAALVEAPPPTSSTRTVDDVLEGGDNFLVVTRTVPSTSAPLVVEVGAPLDDVTDAVLALTRSLLVGVPIVVALLAALVWWLLGRTLRPVEAIRAEVSGIGGTDLHRRVPVPPGDDEVARLATTMNEMLGRVEAAAERQQRFVADASHELRSPLTRIRTEVEVDLAHPEGADPAATGRSVLEEVDGLQRLVDDLLLLARADADPVTAATGDAVDLADVVLEEVHRLPSRAGGARVETAAVDPAVVRGHRDQLARLVRNLLENAVRHATGVVEVTTGVDEGGEWAILSVADDGPGIPTVDAERVFERFARVDDARSPGDGGAGLGLAIAREVAERHGGTIGLLPRGAGALPGACFEVSLPSSR
mgnify:CR=1 FL=1